ncbi:MAG: TetR/AcrR family transcriptional regulator [Novosphingobium sp.]|nr:TetR/AcrR family transcriptional regulator [Novosphingobium sp.]
MAPTRRRRSPEESKAAAITAARELLIDQGPQAVTLKAVADKIGQTHANVLHHFGSAAALQAALAEDITATVCGMLEQSTVARLAGTGTVRQSVDIAFDAFDKHGGAALFAWLAVNGQDAALTPVADAIAGLASAVNPDIRVVESRRRAMLAANLLAFADALIGEKLAADLGVERNWVRDVAESVVLSAIVDENRGAGAASDGSIDAGSNALGAG